MRSASANVVKDLLLRAAGIALLFASYAAALECMALVGLSLQHDPSALEFGCAVLSFLGLCSGSCLVAIGSHVLDKIDVSQRWASMHVATDRS